MGYVSNRQTGDWSRNWASRGSLIKWRWFFSCDHININAYRSGFIVRQSGNRRRDSEVVMGSLIMAVIKWLFKKLTPAAGTLTRGRSLISKAETEVETPKLWAVCSIVISQYLKMRRAKLTLTLASAVTCALAIPSESQEGMDSMRSVAPVLVDVEVAGPSSCMEPRYCSIDLETFFKMRFIVSLMIDDQCKRESSLSIT